MQVPDPHWAECMIVLQWNPSTMATTGTKDGHKSESLSQNI